MCMEGMIHVLRLSAKENSTESLTADVENNTGHE